MVEVAVALIVDVTVVTAVVVAVTVLSNGKRKSSQVYPWPVIDACTDYIYLVTVAVAVAVTEIVAVADVTRTVVSGVLVM